MLWLISVVLLFGVKGLELPRSCSSDQFYDPGSLKCQYCPVNVSMVRSSDGFGCTCDDHSVPLGPGRCRPCSVTETVSSDGTACVKRKCQNLSGRVACRKCPNEYISVTQNLDGSPMREVQCIKCARGFKRHGNTCVRCESCTCARSQVIVRGTCVPKLYVNGRPTYKEKDLHPLELLDAVKHEYLCTQNVSRMCLTLANECVKNFYTSDLGGPCRLWLEPKLTPEGLPSLILSDKIPGEMSLPRGKGVIILAVVAYTTGGGIIFLDDPDKQKEPCQLPVKIKIGNDFTSDCNMNLTELNSSSMNETLSPYVLDDGEFKFLPISIQKPSGHNVQTGSWPNSSFTRYFMVHHSLSTTSNATNVIYLRTLMIRIRLERDSNANGSLRLLMSMEAQYAMTDHLHAVTTSLKVEHVMPSAGVMKGLEIWGGVLGALLGIYALVQWRGVLRRGGLLYSLVPMLTGSAADTLYFAALFTTLHALAAEAGTLGMTLPLAEAEEKMISNFLISAYSLKVLKVAWINWKQCTCDVFFVNWSEYNPPVVKDVTNTNEGWKAMTLAREWSLMQTVRRASPGFTVTGALIILHLLSPWQSYLPQSRGYRWAIASIAWWSSYGIVLLTSWVVQRFVVSPTSDLPKICSRVGLSLLIFQEEYYAHYVHGRNDDLHEARSMAGPLLTCRVACVPQLRAVCKQLSTPASVALVETESRQALLSKFLAAFFERALDGLNWVASERTMLERLLDVELTSREAGGTSALLYEGNYTPSCFCMTWWGEEWNLSTFDAMLFSCVFIASEDALLAALVTVSVWQALKQIRSWLGNKNQVLKTGVDVNFL